MNPASKTPNRLLTGLLVLLATFAFSFTSASAGTETGTSDPFDTVTEEDITTLLSYYDLEEEMVVNNIQIKIYNADHTLIYSAQVCQKEFECDERLNNFINQSDFITDIDNTRIYFLNQ